MSTDLNDKSSELNEEKRDEYSYQPRTRSRKTKPVKEKPQKTVKKVNKFLIIIPCAIIVLVLGIIVSYTISMPKDVIASNVYIAGIDVGGMSEEQAKAEIDGLIFEDSSFMIKSSGYEATINATDINLQVDYDNTVKNAMSVCKSDNYFINMIDATVLLFGDKNIPFEMVYSVDNLDKLLFDFGATFNGFSTEQQYSYTENSITVTPATPGQNPDVSVARNEFISAISNGIIDGIDVTLDYAQPKKLDVDEVYNEICGPAQNATYALDETGNVIVNEHHVGVEVKKEDLKFVIDEINENRSASCSAVITMPEKTKEDLEAKLFNSTLGKYTTDFSSSSSNRAYNVSLAAESINNKILMPGEEFSYNNTIGNPNAERGYKIAGIYENGKTSEGVGGGICQVSSTLYSAVLYADLEIVERHNHSLTVAYVPNGQDATVSYGVIDFRFKNNTEYPVKVSSISANRKLTISIIGTEYEPERTVKLSHTQVSSTPPVDNEKIDETLPAGTRKVESKGKTGYIVDTYKTVYENGVEVSSKKITRSSYRMVPNEVIVGPAIEVTPDVPVDQPVDAPVVDGGNSTQIDTPVDTPSVDTVPPISNTIDRPAPNL